MIFDRTSYDIKKAKDIRKAKIQKFLPITEEEQKIIERGFITLSTIERINTKAKELSEQIIELKYFGSNISIKEWQQTEIFRLSDFEAILNEIGILCDSFFVYSTTPNLPIARYHYTNLNDIEKILYDIDKNISDIKSLYRECGNYECGE